MDTNSPTLCLSRSDLGKLKKLLKEIETESRKPKQRKNRTLNLAIKAEAIIRKAESKTKSYTNTPKLKVIDYGNRDEYLF